MPNKRLEVEFAVDRRQAALAAAQQIADLNAIAAAARAAAAAMAGVFTPPGGRGGGAGGGAGGGGGGGGGGGSAIDPADRIIYAQYRKKVRAIQQGEEAADRILAQQYQRQIRRQQQAEEAADRILARQYQKKVKALEREAKAEAEAAKRGGALGDKLAQFGQWAAGLVGVGTAVSAIKDAFDATNRSVIESMQLVRGYRESLVELAALKGQSGSSSEAMKDQLEFRSKTLQSQEDAREFQMSALDVGQSAIGLNITQEDFEKAMVFGGQLQSYKGGSARAHGQLVGMLPTLLGGRSNAADVMGSEAQLYRIFQEGGNEFGPMANQFLKLAPLVKNKLFGNGKQGVMDAAALMSSFSVTAPGEAGEMSEQFTRATLGGLGRLRGTNIMPTDDQIQIEKQGEYLKKIGATGQMTPIDIGRLVAADFGTQSQLFAQQGKQFNAFEYLTDKGFGNLQDKEALMLFAANELQGQNNKFFGLARQNGNPAGLAGEMSQTFGSDPKFLERTAKLTSEMGAVTQGAGPREYGDSMRRMMFEKLKLDGRLTGNYDDLVNGSSLNPFNVMQRSILNQSTFSYLDEQKKAMGLGPKEPTTTAGKVGAFLTGPSARWTGLTDQAQVETMGKDIGEIADAGGKPFMDIKTFLEASKQQLKAAQMIQDALKGGGKNAAKPAPLRPAAGQPKAP